MKSTFTQDWKDWVTTNVNNGQDKDGIFKILLDEGYDATSIAKEMNYSPSVPFDQLVNPFNPVAKEKKIATKENTTPREDYINPFIPSAIKCDEKSLELYTLDDFLNKKECKEIINLISNKLRPSTLSSDEPDSSYRTSRTCDLGNIDNPFMKDIDNRICKLMGIDSSYSEVIQGQYYEPGQEFKPHTDYFEANEIDQYGGAMGQRTYTFMVYLNDVDMGGETAFMSIDREFQPKRGMAVIWNSLNPNGSPNSSSLHSAKPVIKGYKAVITKWFRSYSSQSYSVPMWSKEKNELIPNYTRTGMKKSKLPSLLFEKISSFYQKNKLRKLDEHVPGDFIITASKRNTSSSVLIDLTEDLRTEIHDCMRPMLEVWCGQDLEPTYVYGIREYQDKAILKSHRDRIDTHIISVIINVNQEVVEDWPLVIEDNYYRTHHIFLKPGEVIFYEGARLKHGRPIPLNGKSYANIFCHFVPINYKLPNF